MNLTNLEQLWVTDDHKDRVRHIERHYSAGAITRAQRKELLADEERISSQIRRQRLAIVVTLLGVALLALLNT